MSQTNAYILVIRKAHVLFTSRKKSKENPQDIRTGLFGTHPHIIEDSLAHPYSESRIIHNSRPKDIIHHKFS